MKKRYTFLPEKWSVFVSSLLFIVVSNVNVQAQTAPNIQWDKSFGGNGNDILTSIKQTSDGGYILGGTSDSGQNGDKSQPSKGSTDYWILKLDRNGNKLWDKSFGGTGDDVLNSFQQTSDGGYILGGYSTSGISGDKSQPNKGVAASADFWIIKLDSSGNKTWDKTFGGNSNDELQVLQQTTDGGYILGGRSNSEISGDKSQPPYYGNYDFWIVKLDSLGNKTWEKTYGGDNDEELEALVQTQDGSYILGGHSTSGMSGDKSIILHGMFDYWLVKLNANGVKIWDKGFGCGSNDILNSLKLTARGEIIMGGFTELNIFRCPQAGLSRGIFDYSIVKTDQQGSKQWETIIGGSDRDHLSTLQITPDSGFIAAGYSLSGIGADKSEASRGWEDIWIVRLDASGSKVWDKTIGGNDREGNFNYNRMSDVLIQIEKTADQGYIVGGYSKSGISGDKTSANKGLFDYWIIKLEADVVTGLKAPETNFVVSISPNPNQGKFTLQLNNLTAPKAEVTVSDLLGRVVLQQQLTVSNKQLSEELTLQHAKGMYLLQLKVGEQLLTRKIVVE